MERRHSKIASKGFLCPINGKSCKLCTLYRGRHYYSLAACKEYQLRLLKPVVRNTKSTQSRRLTKKGY